MNYFKISADLYCKGLSGMAFIGINMISLALLCLQISNFKLTWQKLDRQNISTAKLYWKYHNSASPGRALHSHDPPIF